MLMTGFTKLWSEILTSSIWNEGDKVRIVWITLLACMGPDYMVRASVGGLAHQARVNNEDCRKALDVLLAPDPDSRSKEFEGRRIEERDGGFFILNGGKYREARNHDERKAYMADYMRKWRAEHSPSRKQSRKQSLADVSSREPRLAQAEGEAEADPFLKEGESGTGKPVPPPAAKKESKAGTGGQKISAVWNSFPNLIKIQNIGTSRMKTLQARAKDPFFVENWQEGIKRVAGSDFCTGKNDRAWVATFDWFIRPDSLVRIMEGKYANRNGTGKPQNESERDQRNTGFAPIKPKILE